jgi:hypothetical protein
MSETPIIPVQARHSLFERMRGPMTLLMIALGGFALYYSLFFERKTSYFRDRNARLVATVADQVRRSIRSTASMVSNASTMSERELKDLYRFDRGISEEQRQPQAMFDKLELVADDGKTKHVERRYAQQDDGGLKLVFKGTSGVEIPNTPIDLSAPAADKEPSGAKRYVSATIPLARLINTTVAQTVGDAFDSVFILDAGGNVIYQSVRRSDDESEADVKIVRIKELLVPRMFERESTLQVADLMSASRQMPVRIGDTSYQLFSVPVRSTIAVEESSPSQTPDKDSVAAGVPRDLWVICGVVSNAEFRSRSLALSVTILACLAAAFLLTIFAWPFVKMAMTSAQHKVTLVDVILLGVSGILAASIVCLAVVDWFTYRKLEATADGQLVTLAGEIGTNFRKEVSTAIHQLDAVQLWGEEQIRKGLARPRNATLLAGFTGIERPYFQSVSLIGTNGRQAVKWSVENRTTPLTLVLSRRYYSAPLKEGREYLFFDGRRITIESIRSATSPQPEVVFARRTADTPLSSDTALQREFPVITMSVPSALSLINPVLPRHFGFAIVDRSGTVLFHSDSHRNTVENFFAETDDDPRVKAAVEARQNESMNIRYWGDDYRAYVQPMKDLPWTLITFREKGPLRTLNTEALTITLIFLLAIFAGLVACISVVLLLDPRYRARWVWPDPARVKTYVELSAAYLGLLAFAAVLFLTLHDGALLAFPFWFVPLVFAITYLYLRARLYGPKRLAVVAFAATFAGGLLVLMWRGRSGGWADLATIVAAVLLVAVVVRAVMRPDDAGGAERLRERQTALPLCYVGAAFLLLLVTSAVPATAFFKSAFEMETESYVKWLQMKLADDLQSRWWRLAAEFSSDRGQGKQTYFARRWMDPSDTYAGAVYETNVELNPDRVPQRPGLLRTDAAFPDLVDDMIPRYSDASVKTRELVHDRASDGLWWWTSDGSRIDLVMRNRQPVLPFTISSSVPVLLPTFRNASLDEVGEMLRPRNLAALALALLAILGVTFSIARFIARRVFLVDLVNPLWLSQGFLGLRHVFCHPCDAASASRLFRGFKRIDLSQEADRELARTAPQSFETFEPSVFIDNLDYEFATGEGSKMVRDLIERLTRNRDRTIVLRPTAMNVITASFLQHDDSEPWAKTLSSFVWVNGSQLMTSDKRLTFSGTMPAITGQPTAATNRWRWRSLRGLYVLSGFDVYFEQFSDTRGTIERALAEETEADPYLGTLMTGLGAHASGREQLLDEISERAEDYYNVLWRTCTPNEQLLLMQVAQTGFANGKTRKDVRRLLARGLLRRDPQLRLMNETFRRFVFGQCTTSALAQQLEQNLTGDAWNRFRMPFFAAIAVVMLFFFTTQRQTFDATIALVGGLAAALPTFLKTLSGFGQKSGAKAG